MPRCQIWLEFLGAALVHHAKPGAQLAGTVLLLVAGTSRGQKLVLKSWPHMFCELVLRRESVGNAT